MMKMREERDYSDELTGRQKARRILVVDDEYVNRLLYKEILGKNGFEIIEAENGRIAVDKFVAEGEIGLILMDLNMPVMNGWEASRLIKEYEPDVPLIVVSAHHYNGERNAAMEAGADFFIPKPVDHSKLVYTVESFL